MKNGMIIEFGSKCWYLNELLHHVDGPAVIWPDGSIER